MNNKYNTKKEQQNNVEIAHTRADPGDGHRDQMTPLLNHIWEAKK